MNWQISTFRIVNALLFVGGNALSYLYVQFSNDNFFAGPRSEVVFAWRLSILVQLVILVAGHVLISYLGDVVQKQRLAAGLTGAVILLLTAPFFIELNARNQSTVSIERDLVNTQTKLVNELARFESDIVVRIREHRKYTAEESMELVFLTMNADLGYRGLPDYTEKALNILTIALKGELIDPNSILTGPEYRKLVGTSIAAYPYLVRKPVNDPKEASRLIQLLNLMIDSGADTALKDKNGETLNDYIRALSLKLKPQ